MKKPPVPIGGPMKMEPILSKIAKINDKSASNIQIQPGKLKLLLNGLQSSDRGLLPAPFTIKLQESLLGKPLLRTFSRKGSITSESSIGGHLSAQCKAQPPSKFGKNATTLQQSQFV